jgi:hypothetical protein
MSSKPIVEVGQHAVGRPRLDVAIGQRVGTRVVTEFLPHGRNGQTMVAWECDCGRKGRINASGLFAASTCIFCANSAKSIASQGRKKPRSDLLTAVGDRHGSRVVTELAPLSQDPDVCEVRGSDVPNG